LIKMFSFAGETVLDPFLGSGTTALAAKNLQRNSVGYEINPEFIEFSKQKFNIYQADIAETEYEFLTDSLTSDLSKEIANLPYIFKDPHKLDRKAGSEKRQFGSKYH